MLESLDRRNLGDGDSMFIFSLTLVAKSKSSAPAPRRPPLSFAGPGALYEL